MVFIHEGRFDVQLGEFWLAVGAQIFVAETAHHLVVTIHAGNHQQLFVQLGGLGQGKKRIFMGAARHQVITRTFRGGFGQKRGFDFVKTFVVEEAAQLAGDVPAHFHALLHQWAAQVDIAIAQTGLFVHLNFAFDRERRGLGLVQHFQPGSEHFNSACGHVDILCPCRTPPDFAVDLQHIFAAHAFG